MSAADFSFFIYHRPEVINGLEEGIYGNHWEEKIKITYVLIDDDDDMGTGTC